MSIAVLEMLESPGYELRLELLAGEAGLRIQVRQERICRAGLLLTGAAPTRDPGRVELLGREEIAYLNALDPGERVLSADRLFASGPACAVVADALEPPAELKAAATAAGVPLLATSHSVDVLLDRLGDFLYEQLGETESLHGVLMDVLGLGVLLLGKSGIGKSECALDLVVRGHRLVADDVVVLRKQPPASIYGSCSPLLQHHMEIRGLGIINIKDLYGISAVRDRKKVEVVIELEEWQIDAEYDRLGLAEQSYCLLGVDLPYLKIPVRQGRDITTLVEVATRNLLLKRRGHHSAREFQAQVERAIAEADLAAARGEVVE